jgi:nickel superoxide dismutase
MSILKMFFEFWDRVFPAKVAYAHCDIPCGIYDPYTAQLAVHTVIRMDTLIRDLKVPSEGASNQELIDYHTRISRYTAVKEQYAEMCKHEITVLWSDYFKPEHVQAYPSLHSLIWDTLKLASKTKQSTNMEDAEALLLNVEKVAEIFWRTKNIPTVRIRSFYLTEHDLVVPKV